jgi:hypothetical protein
VERIPDLHGNVLAEMVLAENLGAERGGYAGSSSRNEGDGRTLAVFFISSSADDLAGDLKDKPTKSS